MISRATSHFEQAGFTPIAVDIDGDLRQRLHAQCAMSVHVRRRNHLDICYGYLSLLGDQHVLELFLPSYHECELSAPAIFLGANCDVAPVRFK